MAHEVPIDADYKFLGDLSALNLRTEYRSIKESPADTFYRPCLQQSSLYKRAAGYFRSTIFLVTGPSVLSFVRRGGKVRLICSPELDSEDIDAIALGYARRSTAVVERLAADIDQLLSTDSTAFNTRLLATLVSVGALEIKIAFRADRKGLYHEKIGVFVDGLGHRVSFKGSANETWSAWDPGGNFESIEVFCSWRGGLERDRVARHDAHFDALWSEGDPDVEVFPFPDVALEKLKRASLTGLDNLRDAVTTTERVRRKPLPHQVQAVSAWEAAGSRGVFEHATGSGKTFTSIVAMSGHLAKGLPVLVLVPSQLLLAQWAKELREDLPQAAMLLAGAGNDGWKSPRRLQSMTAADPSLGARIVLATMQTASSPDFIAKLSGGDHLMVVADEVHQSGSPSNSRIYSVHSGPRLGLSATPTRYGDPDGTSRMFAYFGPVVPPSITLNDAIKSGRLVPYEYFPHPVHLSADEAEEWTVLSRSIRQEMAKQGDGDGRARPPLSERAKMLLIRRARVAKKARAKVALAVNVLSAHFRTGQSWLVYCEDSDHLGLVLSALRDAGLEANEYHSNMSGDRDATLAWFRTFGGILVSIRCLDEGVDIPSISHALILASSQNPRQFIQRRGRVLRKSPEKDLAVIHDAIVVPVDPELEQDQMGLLKSELLRAIEFSQHGINRSAGAELRSIAIDMGIDPDTLVDQGIEGDE